MNTENRKELLARLYQSMDIAQIAIESKMDSIADKTDIEEFKSILIKMQELIKEFLE